MIRFSPSLFVVVAGLCISLLGAPSPVSACTYIPTSLSVLITEAAPGDLWWVAQIDSGRIFSEGDTLILQAADDGDELETTVAFVGLSTAIAIQVPPDVAPGRTFTLPEDFQWMHQQAAITTLTVREIADVEALPFPELEVRVRMADTRSIGSDCQQELPITRRQVVSVEVPDGFAVDILDARGEVPFSGNFNPPQPLWADTRSGEVEVFPPGPHEDRVMCDVFVRRLSDGEVQFVSSFALVEEVQVSLCSCTMAPRIPVGLWPFALLVFAFRRRQRPGEAAVS